MMIMNTIDVICETPFDDARNAMWILDDALWRKVKKEFGNISIYAYHGQVCDQIQKDIK